jgi:hypothetical protein
MVCVPLSPVLPSLTPPSEGNNLSTVAILEICLKQLPDLLYGPRILAWFIIPNLAQSTEARIAQNQKFSLHDAERSNLRIFLALMSSIGME